MGVEAVKWGLPGSQFSHFMSLAGMESETAFLIYISLKKKKKKEEEEGEEATLWKTPCDTYKLTPSYFDLILKTPNQFWAFFSETNELWLIHMIWLSNRKKHPWLVWLSGLSIGLWTKRSQVQFPVRAHAWVAGQVPSWGHARGSQLMFLSHIDVSLTLSLPLSLEINRIKQETTLSEDCAAMRKNETGTPDWKL